MTTESQPQTRKPARSGVSLDTWAVGLALAASLLVWLGWIKAVPW
jgi:hypothetical protein